jgi:hypothetical protein
VGQLTQPRGVSVLPLDPALGATARNVVPLPNGAAGTIPAAGGGYFYVLAGALHWVGGAGTDTVIAVA